MLYKINAFSRITNIPADVLQYYDSESILQPSFCDFNTGYRYYNDADFQKASQISILRNLDFSIVEIKDIMLNLDDEKDMPYYLKEKKAFILKEIARKNQLIEKINQFMQETAESTVAQDYQIEEYTRLGGKIITRLSTCEFSDMEKDVDILYKAAKDAVSGDLFNVVWDATGENTYKIGLPVSRDIDDSAITNEELSDMKGLRIFHYGPHRNMIHTYKKLVDYAIMEQIDIQFPFITTYIKGRGKVFKGNENNYVTEIFLPFNKQ